MFFGAVKRKGKNFGAYKRREKEEASGRKAVKTLERFHYSERGSKTRRERPTVGF